MDAEKRFEDLDGKVKEEIKMYENLREKLKPYVCDTVNYINEVRGYNFRVRNRL